MRARGECRVQLPGGLVLEGRLERQAVLQPLTGRLEQCLGELADSTENTPRAVSEVLDRALATLGGKPLQPGSSGQFCVADRQFLMVRLALLMEGDQVWIRPLCERCGAPFDVGLQRSAIPLKPAGPGYPYTQLAIAGNAVKVRAPVGADQEAIALQDEEDAFRELVRRCIVAVDGSAPAEDFVDTLDPAAVEAIEAALDTMAPQLGTAITTACPECGAAQVVELNPYWIPGLGGIELYEEVHAIASHYHWGEAEILALPRERRHLYLNLIERARGVST